MSSRFVLNVEELSVTSFQTVSAYQQDRMPGADSYPDVCTCIDICAPTEDIYCSGGCPPDTTILA